MTSVVDYSYKFAAYQLSELSLTLLPVLFLQKAMN